MKVTDSYLYRILSFGVLFCASIIFASPNDQTIETTNSNGKTHPTTLIGSQENHSQEIKHSKQLENKIKQLLNKKPAPQERPRLSQVVFQNDIEDWLKLINELEKDENTRKEILEFLAIHINGEKIPFNDINQVPVHNDKFTFDGKLSLATVASLWRMPEWIKSLLNKFPSLHVVYDCHYNACDLDNQGQHPVAELVYKQEALRPLFNDGFLGFLRFLLSHRKSMPTWSDVYIHLPKLTSNTEHN
jgi:hypothetical protein